MIGDRPDVAFATKELAREVQQPLLQHLLTAKRILRYLQGTADMALHVTIDRKVAMEQIEVMVDASWANAADR
eukprot:8480283-Heterocapsa_arctica.AAC.1